MRFPLRRAKSLPLRMTQREITGKSDNRIIFLKGEDAYRYFTNSCYREKINNSWRPIYLDLSNRKNLSEYCHYSQNIISVNLSNTNIRYLPDNMTYVKYLYLSGCPISNISKIQSMKSLIELDLSLCSFITDINSAAHVPILNLSYCVGIQDFSMLGNVRNLNLTCTSIYDCSTLCNVPNLNLSGCRNIRDVSMLKNKSLDLSKCYNINDCCMLGYCEQLKLDHTNITSVKGLETVQSLSLVYCMMLQDFSPVYNIPILNVSWCPYVVDVRPFNNKILVKENCFNIKYDQITENSQATDPHIRALSGLIIN